MASLTKAQIIHISALARQAFNVRPIGVGTGVDFTTWRRDQQEIAVGVRSLSHCAAEDYATLRDHFHRTRLSYLKIDTRREVSLAPAMEAIR